MTLFEKNQNYSKGFRFKEFELGVFSVNANIAISKLEKGNRLIRLTRWDFFYTFEKI
jgi:hypothetical protein